MKQRRLHPGLKSVLEQLYATYTARYIHTDPIMFVHRYSSFEDREITALIASSLAFGSVPQIKRSIEDALSRMHGNPYGYVKNLNPRGAQKDFRTFVHRFVRGGDMACLLYLLHRVYRTHGSLYSLFMEGYEPGCRTIGPALTRFVGAFYTMDCSPFFRDGILPKESRVRYLLTSPEPGSACKRMNLFLRWMVRHNDGVDLGIWRGISPSGLIIPLDTHVGRISRRIGLTARRAADWKTALEVTDGLRKFDKDDPVKYDFAFSRLGILSVCGENARAEESCPLRGVCTCTGNSDE